MIPVGSLVRSKHKSLYAKVTDPDKGIFTRTYDEPRWDRPAGTTVPIASLGLTIGRHDDGLQPWLKVVFPSMATKSTWIPEARMEVVSGA